MITDVTVISGVTFSAGTYGLNSCCSLISSPFIFYCEPFFIILIYDSICKLFLYDKYSSLFYKYTGLPHFTPASVNNKSSSSATFIYGIQNLPVCPDGCIYNKSAAKQISSLPALQRFIFAYFSEKSFSDMLIYRTAYRCFRTLSPTFQAC